MRIVKIDKDINKKMNLERTNNKRMLDVIKYVITSYNTDGMIECMATIRNYEKELHEVKLQIIDLKSAYKKISIPDVNSWYDENDLRVYNDNTATRKIMTNICQYYEYVLGQFRQAVLEEKMQAETEIEGEDIELE